MILTDDILHNNRNLKIFLEEIIAMIEEGISGTGVNISTEEAYLVYNEATDSLRVTFPITDITLTTDFWHELSTFTELNSGTIWLSGIPNQTDLSTIYDYILYMNGGNLCAVLNSNSHDEGDSVRIDYLKESEE